VFSVATEGMQAAGIDVGELWVSYEVELRKPVAAGSADLFAPYAHYYSTTGVAAATPFGSARSATLDTMGLTVSSTKLTFPLGTVGTFMLVVAFSGVTASDLTGVFNAGTLAGCSISINTSGTPSSNGPLSTYSVGTAYAVAVTEIRVPDPTILASIILKPGITITGVTGMDVYVSQTNTSAL
jgi:hypothetical protein